MPTTWTKKQQGKSNRLRPPLVYLVCADCRRTTYRLASKEAMAVPCAKCKGKLGKP